MRIRELAATLLFATTISVETFGNDVDLKIESITNAFEFLDPIVLCLTLENNSTERVIIEGRATTARNKYTVIREKEQVQPTALLSGLRERLSRASSFAKPVYPVKNHVELIFIDSLFDMSIPGRYTVAVEIWARFGSTNTNLISNKLEVIRRRRNPVLDGSLLREFYTQQESRTHRLDAESTD